MSHLPATLQVVLSALVLTAAVYDIRFRRIPNWLALVGFIAGFALNTWLFSAAGFKTSCLGAAVALAVYFPLFALRAMGAGDLKLMVAVATFTGPFNWIILFLITALLGGAIAIVMVSYRRQLRRTVGSVLTVVGELVQFRAPYLKQPELDVGHPLSVRLPHAVSIAGGTLLFLALDRLGS